MPRKFARFLCRWGLILHFPPSQAQSPPEIDLSSSPSSSVLAWAAAAAQGCFLGIGPDCPCTDQLIHVGECFETSTLTQTTTSQPGGSPVTITTTVITPVGAPPGAPVTTTTPTPTPTQTTGTSLVTSTVGGGGGGGGGGSITSGSTTAGLSPSTTGIVSTTTTAAAGGGEGGGGEEGGGNVPGSVSCQRVSSLGATTLSCSGTFATASVVGAAPTRTAEAVVAMRALLGGAVVALALNL